MELLAPHSLLDVIGMTGGETALAGNEIELKRPVDGSHANFHLSLFARLRMEAPSAT